MVGQVSKSAGPPFTQHSICGFRYGMKQSANASCLIADWAKGKGEERLLQIPVPVQEHALVFKKGCFPRQRSVKCLANRRPCRCPALAEILSHRVRMLRPADWPVAIVVNLHMPGPPGERDWE